MKPVIVFHFRGRIEVHGRRNLRRRSGNLWVSTYRWVNGWSETTTTGGVIFPWKTKAQCYAEAEAAGAKASFRCRT